MAKMRIEEAYEGKPKNREGRFSLEEEYEEAEVEGQEEAEEGDEDEPVDVPVDEALSTADRPRIRELVEAGEYEKLGRYIADLVKEGTPVK